MGMSDVEPATEPIGWHITSTYREIVVRFGLTPPLRIAEGKWINRRGADNSRGYWLPFEGHLVEVVGSLYDGSEPRFAANVRGHAITKSGAPGAEWNMRYYGWHAGKAPELIETLVEQVRQLAATEHAWPYTPESAR